MQGQREMYPWGSGFGGGHGHDAYYLTRGAGVGSIFSRLYSHVVPLVRSALTLTPQTVKKPKDRAVIRDVKKAAMKAGLNVVSDALQGRDVSISSRVRQAQKDVTKSLKRRAESRPCSKLAKKGRKDQGQSRRMTQSEADKGQTRAKKKAAPPKRQMPERDRSKGKAKPGKKKKTQRPARKPARRIDAGSHGLFRRLRDVFDI